MTHEQCRIVEEDPFVESLQTRRRYDTHVVGEQVAMALVGAQCLNVAAGPIQRRHQQLDAALAQRILADEGLGRAATPR